MTKEQGTLFDDLPAYVGRVSKHPAYRVWKGMIGRCCHPSNSIGNGCNRPGRKRSVSPRRQGATERKP